MVHIAEPRNRVCSEETHIAADSIDTEWVEVVEQDEIAAALVVAGSCEEDLQRILERLRSA